MMARCLVLSLALWTFARLHLGSLSDDFKREHIDELERDVGYLEHAPAWIRWHRAADRDMDPDVYA